MAKEHLNYDQMSLTHGHINSLTQHKDVRALLGHLVNNSPTRVIASYTGGGHIKLYFENDGMVVTGSTPRDPHSVKNADNQIRKSLSSHGFEYQTMNKFNKQKKKQKDSPEEPPAE
jgi:hypothetical protein